MSGNYSGWHTYGAVWDAGVVTYYYDGVEVGLVSEGITSSPMYLILGFGPRTSGTVAGTMLVDYVRIWHRAGATPTFTPVSDTFSSGTVPNPATWLIGAQPGTAAVTGGRMVITAGSGTYTAGPAAVLTGMVPTSDVDLSGDVGTDGTEQYVVVAARVDRFADAGQPYPDNGYYIEMQPVPGQFLVGRVRDGSRTVLGTYTRTFTSAARTGFRLRLVGSVVQVRLWDTSGSEPATWDHNAVDSSPVPYAGKALLVHSNGNNGSRAVSWGNMSAASPTGVTGSAGLGGTGTVTATGSPIPVGPASLSGTGTVTASSSTPRPTATAGLTGQGTVTALGGSSSGSASGIGGSGTVTAATTARPAASAAIGGTGTVTASGASGANGSAAISGTGTVTAGSGSQSAAGTAGLNGSGTLTAANFTRAGGTAGLAGVGLVTASTSPKSSSAASLAGMGVLTTAASAKSAGQAMLGGLGVITAGPTVARAVAAAGLAGSGVLTATGRMVVDFEVLVGGQWRGARLLGIGASGILRPVQLV